MRIVPFAIGAVLATAGCGGPTIIHVPGTRAGASGGDAGEVLGDAGLGSFGDGGGTLPDAGTMLVGDPKTCAEAAQYKSYVGCEYWPTVVPNPVWSIFDFAAVVANPGLVPADVTVTGPNGTQKTATVQPNSLEKIYLPWVAALKGGDATNCGDTPAAPGTMLQPASAYHLVSSVPVIAYQFNALEYKGVGGPPGKDWSGCPGDTACSSTGAPIGCYSFTNDASLLIPTTAMTGNYRASAAPGTSFQVLGMNVGLTPAYLAVTGTQNGTNVTVQLSSIAVLIAGGAIKAGNPGDVVTFKLDAGDVAVLVSDDTTGANDLSGSLVQGDHPIQLLTGVPCANYPATASACDHVEESVLPVETFGKHYVVTVPTSPHGNPVGHIVRVYGNANGTSLTYSPAKPPACPDTLDAGQVADCGLVSDSFEVKGDHEFAVISLMVGASLQDPNAQAPNQEGDPSASFMVAVEQWRTKYVFLAPDDYHENYADIAAPAAAKITLDGAPLAAPFAAIGSGGFGVLRVPLGGGQAGAHVLTADQPVGIQVMGFGAYTSYQYPGGLNLDAIAPPPPPPPPPK